MLNRSNEDIIRRLRNADDASFSELSEIAGLNPARDFKGADLSGVDFSGSNLNGYDFTGALLTNTRFDGAQISGAIFDAEAKQAILRSYTPMSAPQQNRKFRKELTKFQRDVVEKIYSNVETGQRRILASLPLGMGRTSIIEELLRKFDGSFNFRTVLIIVENSVMHDQIKSHLADYVFGEKNVAIEYSRLKIEVVTMAQVRHGAKLEHFDNIEKYIPDLAILIGDVGHLVAMMNSIDQRRISYNTILGFTSFPILTHNSRKNRQLKALKEVFGGVVVIVTVHDAIDAGVLSPVKIEERQMHVVVSGERLNSESYEMLNVVSQDFSREVALNFSNAQCLVICRTQEEVEYIGKILLENIEALGLSSKRVFPISSRLAQREFWYAIKGQDAILVATRSMMNAAPLEVIWSSELIALFQPLEFPFLERLLLRPNSLAVNPATVIDYARSFTPEIQKDLKNSWGVFPIFE